MNYDDFSGLDKVGDRNDEETLQNEESSFEFPTAGILYSICYNVRTKDYDRNKLCIK